MFAFAEELARAAAGDQAPTLERPLDSDRLNAGGSTESNTDEASTAAPDSRVLTEPRSRNGDLRVARASRGHGAWWWALAAAALSSTALFFAGGLTLVLQERPDPTQPRSPVRTVQSAPSGSRSANRQRRSASEQAKPERQTRRRLRHARMRRAPSRQRARVVTHRPARRSPKPRLSPAAAPLPSARKQPESSAPTARSATPARSSAPPADRSEDLSEFLP